MARRPSETCSVREGTASTPLPFSTFEEAVKQQLTGMFGTNGFDAARDIEAITVNRWAHGYSYEYMDLYDPDWEDG